MNRETTQRRAAIAHDERGATSLEYALIASLICVAIIGGLTSFTNASNNRYQSIADTIGGAVR